jgi:hypothetical protein
MDFCSLQHVQDRRSTSRGLLPARYVPSSGFGYPLDGFRPSIPCRFCFAPAALVGFALRSFLLPQGIQAFPPEAPTYRFSRDCARRRSGMPASRAAVSGLLPLRESLAGRHEFNVPSAGCSLGLRPSRVIRRAPWPGFRPASSHALSTAGRSRRRSASEYRSMPAWSHPPEAANRPGWVRQPS